MNASTLIKAISLALFASFATSCANFGNTRAPADRRPNMGSQTATARVQYLR